MAERIDEQLRLRATLASIAPGTPLRDGLERILRGRTGALIVMGLDRTVESISTGGFDSHTTSGITDLAAIARGAGIEHVAAVDTAMGFGEAVIEAFARDALSVIVAKVAAIGPNHYGMDLQLPENAFRFKRWIAARKSAPAPAALTTREPR